MSITTTITMSITTTITTINNAIHQWATA